MALLTDDVSGRVCELFSAVEVHEYEGQGERRAIADITGASCSPVDRCRLCSKRCQHRLDEKYTEANVYVTRL